jgi:cell division protein FtsA
MSDAPKKRLKTQPKDMIFALDIGTRSIIGITGVVEGEKLRVTAIVKEEHAQRSMIDGQIEDIEQVAKVARSVKSRLEDKLGYRLKKVCVAAAGRALKTQRASFTMEFPQTQRLDAEIISRLEAGAIGEAEAAFHSGQEDDNARQFYLVGYTAVQYYLDNYPISSLLDHQGRHIKVDIIATFLPSEVVESLYSAMAKTGLEVASLTLEPIAAINAVIPKKLRLLNLALVDIGAGTSDIAICKDGGIVGYTMVTVAGDEITEALMKKFLLDFNVAELVKTQLGTQESVRVNDILGFEQTITREDMIDCVKDSAATLCRSISEHIKTVNGGPTSAVFLAGGGSKLVNLRDGIAECMGMDVNRVAIAGNNFETYAFSDEYDLNDPEYATPLGIAVSAGLNLISESFQVTLNGGNARLFRTNAMTVLDVLLMNGFSYYDLLPRTGEKLVLEVNGRQTVFYGAPGEPAVLRLNGQEAKISDPVHTGDAIEFTPAKHGKPARRRLKDLLGGRTDANATVNGKTVSPDTLLKNGDIVTTSLDITVPEPPAQRLEAKDAPGPAANSSDGHASPPAETVSNEPSADNTDLMSDSVSFILNGHPVVLPLKADGSPYYLMDMLEYSGLDLENPTGEIVLKVNGEDGTFPQELKSGDHIDIFYAPWS